jgi:hypothetical protein
VRRRLGAVGSRVVRYSRARTPHVNEASALCKTVGSDSYSDQLHGEGLRFRPGASLPRKRFERTRLLVPPVRGVIAREWLVGTYILTCAQLELPCDCLRVASI